MSLFNMQPASPLALPGRDICSLDIETAPADGVDAEVHDKAALDAHRNKITVIATWNGSGHILPTPPADMDFITHGGKFDAKVLITHGHNVRVEQFVHDTMLMGLALPTKVTPDYLSWYSAERKRLNAAAGAEIHRDAGKHSLKTMAPFFLGVAPFWEVADHSDTTYALKDVEYTWLLAHTLVNELKAANTYEFYAQYLIPWSQMLCRAEMRGMLMDLEKLAYFERHFTEQQAEAAATLKKLWHQANLQYRFDQEKALHTKYETMKAAAIARSKYPTNKNRILAEKKWQEKLKSISERYHAMFVKAQGGIRDILLSSHDDVKWVLKEVQGYDITSYISKKESSDKAVLQSLADQGKEDAATLLKLREAEKLVTSYFPSYRTLMVGSVLHSSFHMDTTRTGRLSSSSANLQQISKQIQSVFVPRPGYKFVYRDVSAVEPRLIAYHTECPELSRIFIEGTDFHSENVRTIMGSMSDDATIKKLYSAERDFIKEFGLSLIYGAGPRRIQVSSVKRKFPRTFAQCRKDYAVFKEKYQAVFEYKEQLEERIRAGDVILNVIGRPVNYDDVDLHMTSMNTVMQSGGSDLLLASACITLKRCAKAGIDAHPVAFIHDAAILEVEEGRAEEVDKMFATVLNSWELPLTTGELIPLKSDGGVKDRL